MGTTRSGYKLVNGQYGLTGEPKIGGMSEIYSARDLATDRKVAVKIFKSGTLDSSYLRESYEREVLALSQLKHPAIVELVDHGVDKETQLRFLVLEWVETDLHQFLAKTSFDKWDGFYFGMGRTLLEGLAFAHSRDLAHRDIKPSNILVDAGGNPKLADFGISKLKTYLSPTLTLNQFASPPYCPKEIDDGSFSSTRDVFGIAAVFVECLTQQPLTTYEELYSALDRAPLPISIHGVLKRALDASPDKRQQNAAVLLAEVEAMQQFRGVDWIPRKDVNLELSQKALSTLFELYPTKTEAEVLATLLSDLNLVCALIPRAEANLRSGMTLYGATFICQAFVALPQEDHLLISSLAQVSPSITEKRREFGLPLNVRFRQGRPANTDQGRQAILTLLEELEQFKFQMAVRDSRKQEEELFRTWSAVLKAKTAIEKARENPISYDGFSVNGNRVIFRTVNAPVGDLTGQARLVKAEGFVRITGDVESSTSSDLTLYVTNWYSRDLPQKGVLSIDIEAATLAIERQRAALEAVRLNKAVRSDLGSLLLHPDRSRKPKSAEPLRTFQKDLDEPKVRAVVAALKTEDFLVVEGPPGTGKTTFITELILQTLRSSPESRILLTSQTHVALDNALENLLTSKCSHRIVRIGRSDNSRISKTVEDLLLDSQMEAWRIEVLSKGQAFLEKWARENKVSHKEVKIGMEFEKLSIVQRDVDELEARRSGVESQIKELVAIAPGLADKKSPKVPDADEIEKYGQLDDELAKIRAEIRRRSSERTALHLALKQLEPDAAQLLNLPADDLRNWSETYLPKSPLNQRLKRLFETHAEWQARFGRTPDFQAALLRAAQVVAGTCVGIAAVKGLSELEFDLCIVDEASKATPTEMLVPLARSQRWVIVGDQKQLPPFLDEGLRDRDLLQKFNLDEQSVKATLFGRLHDLLPQECKTMLSTQYRMVPAIGGLISHCFYDDLLKSAPKEWDRSFVTVLAAPVNWISTSDDRGRAEREVGDSYLNELEAKIVHSLLVKLNPLALKSGRQWKIAVLTGYAPQRTLLERRFARDAEKCAGLDVELNTVDAIQGRQADVTIYSVTRSNPAGRLGFLRDASRLNVALSRPKQYLVLVGDQQFFKQAAGENPFKKVIEYIESHPNDCCVRSTL
jgi:superfamily I DNA and/or RNA helicase/serine/threonine protein kinase